MHIDVHISAYLHLNPYTMTSLRHLTQKCKHIANIYAAEYAGSPVVPTPCIPLFGVRCFFKCFARRFVSSFTFRFFRCLARCFVSPEVSVSLKVLFLARRFVPPSVLPDVSSRQVFCPTFCFAWGFVLLDVSFVKCFAWSFVFQV